MTNAEQNELDVAAILDAYVYLDDQNVGYEDWTLKDIVSKMDTSSHYYGKIQEAITRMPELGDYRLVSQSVRTPNTSLENGDTFNTEELYACAFKSPNGEYYVAYRGTGDGKWVDNGEGMYKESTIMQRRAAEFFDSVVERQGLSESDRIVLTGHSKGGNSAQFATLASKYNKLVDSCYSLDGQGFSQKAIEMFKRELGTDYQSQLNKMFSVNGENDYVHDLGIAVISEDRTFFVATPDGKDIAGMHDVACMIVDGEIVLDFDNPISQGEVGKFAKQLSAEIMALDDASLEDCSLTIMSLLERFFPSSGEYGLGEKYKEGTGEVKSATVEDYWGGLTTTLPLVIKVAMDRLQDGLTAYAEKIIHDYGERNANYFENWIKGVKSDGSPALSTVMGTFIMDKVFSLPDNSFVSFLSSFMDGLPVTGSPGIGDAIQWFDDLAPYLAAMSAKSAVTIGLASKITALTGATATIGAFAIAALKVIIIAVVVIVIAYLVIKVLELVIPILADAIATSAQMVGVAISLAVSWVVEKAAVIAKEIAVTFNKALDEAIRLGKIAVEVANAVKQAIANAVQDFVRGFTEFAQSIIGAAKNWIKNIFGSASAAISLAGDIVVTISRVEDMQRTVANLRNTYIDSRAATNEAKSVVDRVYSYYNESYVRSCCREIENDLNNARKYIDSAEKSLDKKRRILAEAVESYRRSDQEGAANVRKTAASFA